MEAHLKVKQSWHSCMQMNTTITKIAKSLDTPEEREANQFAIRVKVKNVCSYGTEQPCKEEQETIEKAWVKYQRNKSGYETSILQSLNSTVKKDQRRSFVRLIQSLIKEKHEGVYSVFPQALNSQLEKKSVI